MKHELIKTENYLLVVDYSEIKEGDWHLKNDKMITCAHLIDDSCKKIIAHLPLNGSPLLEGVDLLPELSDENIISNVAVEFIENQIKDEFGSIGNASHRVRSFIDGYNKAKQKYKYTAEDVKKAYVQGGADKYYEFDKFINSLYQPKLPVAFEQTILNNEEWYNAPAAILNSSGQVIWVGNYIFND